MKQAANLRDFRVGLLLPASRINTSATDYRGVTYMQLQRSNGASWDEVKHGRNVVASVKIVWRTPARPMLACFPGRLLA